MELLTVHIVLIGVGVLELLMGCIIFKGDDVLERLAKRILLAWIQRSALVEHK